MPDTTAIQWHLAPGVSSLDERLLTTRWLDDAEVIKRHERRGVYRLPPRPGQTSGLYVKHNTPGRWADWIKLLWRCKARVEFKATLRLREAGLPVVPMLAWARCGGDSFAVSREVVDAEEFRHVWPRLVGDPRARGALIDALTGVLRRIVTVGLRHPDFHAGNVLVQDRDGDVRILLLDVVDSRLNRNYSASAAAKMMLWLNAYLYEMDADEMQRVLRAALPDSVRVSTSDYRLMIERWSGREARRRWRSRRVKMMIGQSVSRLWEDEHGRWRVREGVESGPVIAAVTACRNPESASASLLKSDRNHRIWRVNVGTGTLVVKRISGCGRRWVRDPAKASWLNSYRLWMQHIPAVKILGWLQADGGDAFLVMADLGDRSLRDVLQETGEGAGRERRALVRAAARLLARMHRCGIYHRDLKHSNWMAVSLERHTDLSLALIDLDRISFGPRVAFRRRCRNLCQLIAGLRNGGRSFEGARFLLAYADDVGLSRAERRSLAARVKAALPPAGPPPAAAARAGRCGSP